MIDKNQRIAIQQIALVENGTEICVELKYNGNTYQGKSTTGTDELAQMTAATNALITAVNSIIPTPIVKRVIELKQISFQALNLPVVVALVAVQIRGQEMFFPGAAKTEESSTHAPIHAAVRATLDAINRPIGLII
ncbi:MAG: hypothetical protein AB1489_17225 [Acidobacteriota bacterium]